MKNQRPTSILEVLFLIFSIKIIAQYANHRYPQLPEEFNSQWITHPNIDKTAFGLIHFRSTIQLDSKPEYFDLWKKHLIIIN